VTFFSSIVRVCFGKGDVNGNDDREAFFDAGPDRTDHRERFRSAQPGQYETVSTGTTDLLRSSGLLTACDHGSIKFE
jgi:hypothetical protein